MVPTVAKNAAVVVGHLPSGLVRTWRALGGQPALPPTAVCLHPPCVATSSSAVVSAHACPLYIRARCHRGAPVAR